MGNKRLSLQSLVAFADWLTIGRILRLSAGVAVVVGALMFLLAPPQYTADCAALFSQRPDVIAGLGLLGAVATNPWASLSQSPLGGAMDPTEKWATQLLKSRLIRQQAMDLTGLAAKLGPGDVDDHLDWLASHTTVKGLQKTVGLGGSVGLDVEVTCPGPGRLFGWLGWHKPFTTSEAQKMAADLANAYMAQVNSYSAHGNVGAASETRQFVEKRMGQCTADLNRVEKELQRFRTQYVLMDPESRGVQLGTALEAVTEEVAGYRADEKQNSRVLQTARMGLARQQDSQVVAEVKARNPVIASLDQQLSTLQLQLAAATAEGKGPRHPDVVTLQAGIRDAQAQMRQISDTIFQQVTHGPNPFHDDLLKQVIDMEVTLAGLRARMSERQKQLRKVQVQFAQLPPLARRYGELQREEGVLTNMVTVLRQRLEVSKIEERQEKSEKMEILDPAHPPTKKSGPSTVLTAGMSFILALLGLGGLLAWRRGVFSDDAPAPTEGATGKFASLP